MFDTYSKAYTEVWEIIKNLPKVDYNKIPKEEIEFFEKNKDNDYKFKINSLIALEEQNFSLKTKAIIVVLYKKYFATEKQNSRIDEILILNERKSELEKSMKYNISIFNTDKIDIKENTELVVIEKKNFIKKILDKFKKIFRLE